MLVTVGKLKGNHWILKDDSIEIFHAKPSLFSKPQLYQSIPLQNIHSIKIYWKNVLMGHIWKYAHPLYMDIHTFDKTVFSIELNTSNGRDNLIQAMSIIKSKNIPLIDKYDILGAINNAQQNIWEYIEKTIKENDLGYK